MNILIVESDHNLGQTWAEHIEEMNGSVALANCEREAIDALRDETFDAVVLDLTLSDGSALAVADFASFRCPNARVIFVTHDEVFSDGSIFSLSHNASAFLQSDTPPADLAAIVDYHAAAK